MKTFKKEIKRRKRIIVIMAIVAPLIIMGMTIISALIQGNSISLKLMPWNRIAGFLAGIEVVAILRIRRFNKAIKDKDTLEELQVQEEDERNQLIQRKTSYTSLMLGIMLIGYGAIIAAFFSTVVFYTCSAILIGLIVLYLIVLTYFKRTM